MIWLVSVLIIATATATFHLLAPVPVPDWWAAILEWLPDYLIPEYSVADLPPVLLTILAAVTLIVGVIRWIVAKSRLRLVLPPLTAEQIQALTLQPKEHFDALIAERGSRLQRWSTWGVVFGLLFTAGSLVYTARSLETSRTCVRSQREYSSLE